MSQQFFFPKKHLRCFGFSFSLLPREGSKTEEPDEQGMGCETCKKLGGSSGGRSETGVPDERGWDVKRGNSLGGAAPEGARECRTNVDGM